MPISLRDQILLVLHGPNGMVDIGEMAVLATLSSKGFSDFQVKEELTALIHEGLVKQPNSIQLHVSDVAKQYLAAKRLI